MFPVVDFCRRCGAAGSSFFLGKDSYCRDCFEMSFRVASPYRLHERRDPQREPRGYGRRFTDRLTGVWRRDDS